MQYIVTRRNQSVFSLFLFLCFSAGVIRAESPKPAVSYLSNFVIDIAEDGDYLWLASDAGLVKFNKTTGERVYFTEENSNIPSDNTRSVAIIDGDIWVGTNLSGIGIFNGATWDSLTTSNSGLETDVAVWDFEVIDTDDIWIANGRWACHLKDGAWQSFQVFEEIYSWKVMTIVQDHLERVWLGTSHGLYTIQDDSAVLYDAIPLGHIYFFAIAQDSTLWFGGNGELYSIHTDTIENYTTDNSDIPFGSVLGLDIDPSGNLWIGGPGLAVFNGESWQGYDTSDCAALQAAGPVYCDDDGIVWIGTNANGLIRFDGETWTQYDIIPGVTTAVEEDVPVNFVLLTASPNPFNPQTSISFTLPEASAVTLSVYNVSGQKVATLMDGYLAAGNHSAVFDGSGLASGVYVYRCEAAGAVRTGKMVLVK